MFQKRHIHYSNNVINIIIIIIIIIIIYLILCVPVQGNHGHHRSTANTEHIGQDLQPVRRVYNFSDKEEAQVKIIF